MWKKEDRVQKAKELFRSGYNCCQAVFLAFSDDYGLDRDLAMKLACSFGGGMGRMKLVCGAVCAMAFVAGLENGNTNPEDKDAKRHNYEMVRYLNREFSKENGSIICSELIGLEGVDSGEKIKEHSRGYYVKKPDAVRILEKQFYE